MRSRVVNLVYGDNGAAGNVQGDLGELMVLLQKVPRAYLRIIRKRVADARRAVGARTREDDAKGTSDDRAT